MLFGIFLIVAGILIAVYPPLLSLIVASFFILGGTFLVFLSYSYKKLSRTRRAYVNPFFIQRYNYRRPIDGQWYRKFYFHLYV